MVAAHKRDRCTVRPAPAAEPWHGDLARRFFSVSVKVWLPRSNTRAPRLEFGRLRSYDSFHVVRWEPRPTVACFDLPKIAVRRAREERDEAHDPANRRLRPARLSVLPQLLRRGGSRAAARGGREHTQDRAPGSMAREIRRAAYRVCLPYLQRSVPSARASSAPGGTAATAIRRGRLRPSVQDQRQGRLRRRRV